LVGGGGEDCALVSGPHKGGVAALKFQEFSGKEGAPGEREGGEVAEGSRDITCCQEKKQIKRGGGFLGGGMFN